MINWFFFFTKVIIAIANIIIAKIGNLQMASPLDIFTEEKLSLNDLKNLSLADDTSGYLV